MFFTRDPKHPRTGGDTRQVLQSYWMQTDMTTKGICNKQQQAQQQQHAAAAAAATTAAARIGANSTTHKQLGGGGGRVVQIVTE